MIGTAFRGVAMIPLLIIYLFFIGLSVYCLVLFIKLAQRGIKALDIYIRKNGDDGRNDV